MHKHAVMRRWRKMIHSSSCSAGTRRHAHGAGRGHAGSAGCGQRGAQAGDADQAGSGQQPHSHHSCTQATAGSLRRALHCLQVSCHGWQHLHRAACIDRAQYCDLGIDFSGCRRKDCTQAALGRQPGLRLLYCLDLTWHLVQAGRRSRWQQGQAGAGDRPLADRNALRCCPGRTACRSGGTSRDTGNCSS